MIQIDFENLRLLGLTPALAQLAANADEPDDTQSVDDLRLMRLTEVHRETVRVHDGEHEHRVRVLPRLMRELADADTALAVGDWVLCGIDAYGEYRVHARVPPLSNICRRDADGRRHPVVSNVDTALLVMGLDDDFNPRRLERYLALVQASGVLPVVVLTKADVASHTPGLIESRIEALRGRVPAQVEVLAVDGTHPSTAPRLRAWLAPGQTVVVLGSSGAGKSTLTNNLLGAAVQDTGAVRAHDSRGKHTTTSRSLHRLPGGACVIDTPGLRTLRPDADEGTLAAVFEDVDTLAPQCRFRDCRHVDEPGCAVREGVEPDRLRNFHKLLREARRDTLTVLERQQQLAVWKQRGKANRARTRFERGQE
jgi:ribosome biogenesis GTPase